MRHLKKILSAGLLGAALLHGPSAVAAPQTYVINMDCTDCAQAVGRDTYPVWATLTLEDYAPGTWMTDTTQFVSFSYGGSNLVAPFSVTRSGNDGNPNTVDYLSHILLDDGALLRNYHLSANLSNIDGPNNLFFQFGLIGLGLPRLQSYYLLTSESGVWSMCAPGSNGIPLGGDCFVPSDYGTNAIYTATPVPEPSHLAMLSAGLLLLGAAVRRSKRD